MFNDIIVAIIILLGGVAVYFALLGFLSLYNRFFVGIKPEPVQTAKQNKFSELNGASSFDEPVEQDGLIQSQSQSQSQSQNKPNIQKESMNVTVTKLDGINRHDLSSSNEVKRLDALDEPDDQKKQTDAAMADNKCKHEIELDELNKKNTPIELNSQNELNNGLITSGEQAKIEVTSASRLGLKKNKPRRRVFRIKLNFGIFHLPKLSLPHIKQKKSQRQDLKYHNHSLDPIRQEHKRYEAEFRRKMQQKDEDFLRELKQRRQ